MKVFMIAGEDSGDSLGASLISALEEIHGDALECMGVGGPKMSAAGFDELLPLDQISVVGLWEVLPKIPRLIKINKAIVEEIEKQQPDVVVTIDFPDFNFIIGKNLKKRGVYKGKIVHYVSPSVWAWRPERAKKIASFLDGIICLFPMEPEYYTKHGLSARFIGHPIASLDVSSVDAARYRADNDITPETKTLGLFLGSRETELKKIAPAIVEAAKYINEVYPHVHVIVPTLPKTEFEVQQCLTGLNAPMIVAANPLFKWESFKACDLAIAVSGTVALELAYVGVPHVIAYKLNPVTALILRFLVKVKHVHLANILLGKDVVPEFLQGKCNGGTIAQHVMKMMRDETMSKTQVEAFQKLPEMLGYGQSKTPSQKAAEFIGEIVSGQK